jgi:hypothetical protein
MAAATKTAPELEALIMAKLRDAYPQCDDFIDRVVVTAAGRPGHWIAEAVVKPGAQVPADCHRLKSSIANKLRREYDLSS